MLFGLPVCKISCLFIAWTFFLNILFAISVNMRKSCRLLWPYLILCRIKMSARKQRHSSRNRAGRKRRKLSRNLCVQRQVAFSLYLYGEKQIIWLWPFIEIQPHLLWSCYQRRKNRRDDQRGWQPCWFPRWVSVTLKLFPQVSFSCYWRMSMYMFSRFLRLSMTVAVSTIYMKMIVIHNVHLPSLAFLKFIRINSLTMYRFWKRLILCFNRI